MEDLFGPLINFLGSLSVAVKVSSFAALCSLASVIIAARSARNSSRALRLSEAQEKRRVARMNISVGQAHYQPHNGGRLYRMTVLVENPTDSSGAVSKAELRITYSREGTLHRLLNSASVDRGLAEALDLKKPPFDVSARSAVSAPLAFEFSAGLFGASENIEAYELIVTDAMGNAYPYQFPALINERN